MAGVNDNLIPPVKGEVRNPKGKPKGTKHLKTIIQEIGHNIDWDKTTLKDKDRMKELYGNNAWKAIVYVAVTMAAAGDIKAMDWLAKNGYGTNIDVTSDGERITGATITFSDHPKAHNSSSDISA